jgi:hypothetical protein
MITEVPKIAAAATGPVIVLPTRTTTMMTTLVKKISKVPKAALIATTLGTMVKEPT